VSYFALQLRRNCEFSIVNFVALMKKPIILGLGWVSRVSCDYSTFGPYGGHQLHHLSEFNLQPHPSKEHGPDTIVRCHLWYYSAPVFCSSQDGGSHRSPSRWVRLLFNWHLVSVSLMLISVYPIQLYLPSESSSLLPEAFSATRWQASVGEGQPDSG
jgi:hypothetical protein